tara:strand:- start:2861 stop:3232 length:372 start_codon:yes stop_codon:yes gene_type:complete
VGFFEIFYFYFSIIHHFGSKMYRFCTLINNYLNEVTTSLAIWLRNPIKINFLGHFSVDVLLGRFCFPFSFSPSSPINLQVVLWQIARQVCYKELTVICWLCGIDKGLGWEEVAQFFSIKLLVF